MKPLRKKLISSLIMAIIIFVELLLSIFSFSWFSASKTVNATGMQVSVADVPTITVENQAGTGESTNKVQITVVPEVHVDDDTSKIKKVSPDTYGYFTFTITTNVSAYDITTACVVDDAGFKSVVNTEADKAQHLMYLNSHILFFRSYDATSNMFSDWIEPGKSTRLEVTPNEPNEITIYWVWISSYDDMSTGSEKINSKDIPAINTYILAHPGDFFDSKGEEFTISSENKALLKRYYDYVDENIGNGIDIIHMEVSFNV